MRHRLQWFIHLETYDLSREMSTPPILLTPPTLHIHVPIEDILKASDRYATVAINPNHNTDPNPKPITLTLTLRTLVT